MKVLVACEESQEVCKAFRFMTRDQKKIMLNSLYGYMVGGGHDGL